MIFLCAAYAALFVTGLVGAYVTKNVQQGVFPIWAPVGASIISGVIWGAIARQSRNLSLASVLVDVIYTASFVLGFYILGDRLTSLQFAGLIVSILGVAMMAS